MANYRLEIDALNALVDAQNRTNELLEQLIELNTQKPKETPIQASDKPIQRRGRKKA